MSEDVDAWWQQDLSGNTDEEIAALLRGEPDSVVASIARVSTPSSPLVHACEWMLEVTGFEHNREQLARLAEFNREHLTRALAEFTRELRPGPRRRRWYEILFDLPQVWTDGELARAFRSDPDHTIGPMVREGSTAYRLSVVVDRLIASDLGDGWDELGALLEEFRLNSARRSEHLSAWEIGRRRRRHYRNLLAS